VAPAVVPVLPWYCRRKSEYHGGIEVIQQSRLLVVEDDPGVRTTIVTCLELEGYEVDAASSTKEAIDRLSATSYPIVISDICIDDRTGLDVLEAARLKDPGCSVIVMTDRGTGATVKAAACAGR